MADLAEYGDVVTSPGRTLSEADSKSFVRNYGVPVADERVVDQPEAAVEASRLIGLPVVMKLVGDTIAHKSERGLVRLNLGDETSVAVAARELLAGARPDDGPVALLVAPMIRGNRELIAGVVRDPTFGPMVMLGLGGVLAEAVGDVVFRPAPLDLAEAQRQIDALESQALLGAFRGEQAVDRQLLAETLVGLGRLAIEHPEVASVDINPMIVTPEGRAVAVDALIEIGSMSSEPEASPGERAQARSGFDALFDPKGVVVTGASTHPGKFGFVALHNILASGYTGRVAATNLGREEVLGVETVASVSELDPGQFDLAVVCTPASANLELLRECAAIGVRAAFLTSAGYGEAGVEGAEAQRQLVAVANELGILLAGPNGQGVVSTPASLCAQIVAPMPPRGSIGVASQSGNLVSTFLNLARATGVGVSRAVSAGNAADVGVGDYLAYFAADDETTVGLAYLEGITDGPLLMDALRRAAAEKPMVVLKGGATESGARAAASHTGALAANHRVFAGVADALGVTRVESAQEAFETAATFATQPLPRGPRVAVLTTAGGWGVLTADTIAEDRHLELATLPADLMAAIDERLPSRWSRNNPVDCAGGETRDTIPEVLELLVAHEAVDAVVYLGIGIQSNQARLMREGGFHPDHGLERIVDYHERQDRRFAEEAARLSNLHAKPVLVATELATADPDNAAVRAVVDSGRLCYSGGDRAARALGHLYRYARFRGLAAR